MELKKPDYLSNKYAKMKFKAFYYSHTCICDELTRVVPLLSCLGWLLCHRRRFFDGIFKNLHNYSCSDINNIHYILVVQVPVFMIHVANYIFKTTLVV